MLSLLDLFVFICGTRVLYHVHQCALVLG